jgi:hypothetical protein
MVQCNLNHEALNQLMKEKLDLLRMMCVEGPRFVREQLYHDSALGIGQAVICSLIGKGYRETEPRTLAPADILKTQVELPSTQQYCMRQKVQPSPRQILCNTQ